MIGLGKMGGNMVERLMKHGHSLVAFDRDASVVSKYEKLGAAPAGDLAAVVKQLETPRVIWIMVPAGKPVDSTIDTLLPQSNLTLESEFMSPRQKDTTATRSATRGRRRMGCWSSHWTGSDSRTATTRLTSRSTAS